MIVSFSKRFIFIKTRKTAGTSMEIALSEHCADGDIVTPISPEDEVLRFRRGGLPRNFSTDKILEQAYRDAIKGGDRKAIKRALRDVAPARVFRNHMSAKQVRAKLPRDIWDSFFTFTIERHPYEKAVSQGYFRYRRSKKKIPFDEFLQRVVEKKKYRNFNLYSVRKNVVVEKIYKYEGLNDCLEDIEKMTGTAIKDNFPRAKSQHRADRRTASEILSEQQKAIIREACSEEFDLLGYQP